MNKQQLAAKIWESANRMRGKVDASEYKDFILGFIFYKYLSEKEEQFFLGEGMTAADMEQLVEEGIVRKYVLDGKSSACYQFLSGEPHACTEHFHLKCTQCGQLFHVSCDYLNQLGEHLLEHHGFVIDHTKTVLYGLCAACAKKKS